MVRSEATVLDEPSIGDLIVHELGTVVDRHSDDEAVFGAELERLLITRLQDLDVREL
ncbi:MAG: hypothetical protein QGM46_11130 [Actinomycetota bacterium]|nr:hypothetical protein [Actinomycetota bacterium]MDK1019952.1 hypothetical protein [Actinomycetota bacterium]MDK1027630.1 hypothetical protein [Actinomycetota bacterium]MDK1039402.1 hypothetical protein [Actinomycetota bacterium]MDK1104202.1 hypothetical protein [Actinomycetota bacterium]